MWRGLFASSQGDGMVPAFPDNASDVSGMKISLLAGRPLTKPFGCRCQV
jgi:hypothetical protein